MKEIKKIAILTSGGDSPGMNKVIATLVDYANKYQWDANVVINGYKGLYENRIKKAQYKLIMSQSNLAGSIILCSRFPLMNDQKVINKCIENLKQHKIDLLFVLGGNGSFTGASKLMKAGVNVICIPCTIDNDVACTEYTIGFDSALNVCVNTIDQLRATSDSHGNNMIVEVMGRRCSDLTIASSYATNVDYIITQHNIKTPEQIVEIIKKLRSDENKKSVLILVSELIYNGTMQMHLDELKKFIENQTKIPTKTHVIGFVQRGANPSAIERYNASRISRYAIEQAAKGNVNVTIGFNGTELITSKLMDNFERKEDIEKVKEAIKLINKVDYL